MTQHWERLGTYVRLVGPKFDGEPFSLQRAPLIIPPIMLHTSDSEDDDGSDTSKESTPVKTFKDIQSIPVRSCVPSIIAMVTSLSNKRKVGGPSGYIRTAGLTDHTGEKTAVNLFGDITDKVEKDCVYEFKNLEKRDFKKKTDKGPFCKLQNRMRQRGLSAWDIQIGPFASL